MALSAQTPFQQELGLDGFNDAAFCGFCDDTDWVFVEPKKMSQHIPSPIQPLSPTQFQTEFGLDDWNDAEFVCFTDDSDWLFV